MKPMAKFYSIVKKISQLMADEEVRMKTHTRVKIRSASQKVANIFTSPPSVNMTIMRQTLGRTLVIQEEHPKPNEEVRK